MQPKTNISDVFSNAKSKKTYIKVCAPMVRYSKVQFRTLVRNFGVDLCFTPMILADSFCQNTKARTSEFSSTFLDTPVIVQFAANNVNDYSDATQLIVPYADGVDLNCGCPQRWAMKDGYGCALLNQPQVIYEMVRAIKNKVDDNFSVSVKIRILNDLKKTIDMCRQMESCGVTFLTVHGRTPAQKSGDNVDSEALAEVCNSVRIPIIANGGIKTLEDAENLYENTMCDGVMAASGLLTNPALFNGYERTPFSCVKLWMKLKNECPEKISFQCYHHHLVFMLDKLLSKSQKQVFNLLSTFQSVDDYLYEHFVFPEDVELEKEMGEFIECEFDESITKKHSTKCRGCSKSLCYCICIEKYDSSNRDGSFFNSHVKQNECDLDYMDCNMFDEV